MQVLDQYPIIVMPSLVRELGLEEAVLLQKIYFWYCETNSGRIVDGERWIYNNYQTWAEQTGMTKKQVIRGIAALEKRGVLITMIPDGTLDRTKHYTITTEWIHRIQNGQLHVPKRADGLPKRADDTILSSYKTPKETNTPFAETGVSAPQPFASPLLPTAESILRETQKQSAEERKKKVKLAFPTLEELEAQIDGWWQSWELWKTTTLPRQNKSGEISHAALATILADLLEKQNRYNLSADAMRHGFSAAIGKGIWNVNYVINTAKGYKG